MIGRDPLTDSALIQLTQMPKHPLTEAKFGDSSQMAAGDWVVAIGNPFGYAHTVTVGVISAIGRPFYNNGRTNEMIQTDAAINPGNSGGPLLNIRGEVIGINTAIISSERGGKWATSARLRTGQYGPRAPPQLRTGKIVRGRIGVQVAVPRDDSRTTASKRAWERSSPRSCGRRSAKAGIHPSDVIIEFGTSRVQPGRTREDGRRHRRACQSR